MLSSIYRGGVIYDTIDIIEIRIIIAIQMKTFEKWTRPLSKFIEKQKPFQFLFLFTFNTIID